MVTDVFLGLGSNKGNRKRFITNAILELKADKKIEIVNCSSLYETKPYGITKQADFLNMVVKISCAYDPAELFTQVKSIEDKLGRIKGERWGPREIDIDILFYSNMIIRKEYLIIPHNDLTNRDFVLTPLCEIAPDFYHPVYKKKVSELLSDNPAKTILSKINFSIE